MPLWLWVSLALAEPVRWEASAGGEVGVDGHYVGNVAVETGAWRFAVYTDTPEVTWQRETERGRAWVSGRAVLFAAGMLLSPWTDGAPDRSRALIARAIGPSAGAVRYLGQGWYAGGYGSGAWWTFSPASRQVTATVPDPTVVLTADAVLGLHRDHVQGWVRAGTDWTSGVLAPHAHLRASGRPDWTFAPRWGLHAGVAERQGLLTSTRLGGMNPYVVPLAGAAWAEFRVEDYAVGQLGPSVKAADLELGARADLAWFDGETAAGFAATGRWQSGRPFAEASVGHAPWIARQPGVGRTMLWLLVGIDMP